MSVPSCNRERQLKGLAYPRTCEVCALGPCRVFVESERVKPVKALSPQNFLSTSAEDEAAVLAMIDELNGVLLERNPDLRANPDVYVGLPRGWSKARAAVREGVEKAFGLAGWKVRYQSDQRDGDSLVLSWDGKE